jgi:hypothetical protein
VWARNSYLVCEIDEILLPEKKCHHEIDRGCAPDIRCQRMSVFQNHKGYESD